MLHILLHILGQVGMSLLWLALSAFTVLLSLVLLPALVHELCHVKVPLRRGDWVLDFDSQRVGVGVLLSRNWRGDVRQVGIHWGFHTLTWEKHEAEG